MKTLKINNDVYLWLNKIVSEDINPTALTNHFTLGDADQLIARLEERRGQFIYQLQANVFRSKDEHHARLSVRNHHDSLVALIGKSQDNVKFVDGSNDAIGRITSYMYAYLEEVIEKFEKEFHPLLDTERLVPITRLLYVKETVLAKRENLLSMLSGGEHGEDPVYIMQEFLEEFIFKVENNLPVRQHDLDYLLAVIHDVEHLSSIERTMTTCPPLHELLFYWNLNSKTTIAYFTHGTEAIINAMPSEEERIEYLRYQLKVLRRIPVKEDFVYNSDYPSMKEYFVSWITNEIEYRESKAVGFVPLRAMPEKITKNHTDKVKLNLSTDQAGIFLFAAYRAGIVDSRSVRSLFKELVPNLSTVNTENPSWDTMRSQVYSSESRDEDIVVDYLQKMIGLIKKGHNSTE